MLTDDPGTPGDGVWEINMSYQEQRTRQDRSRSLPHADFTFGVGSNVQLQTYTGRLSCRRHAGRPGAAPAAPGGAG